MEEGGEGLPVGLAALVPIATGGELVLGALQLDSAAPAVVLKQPGTVCHEAIRSRRTC